MATAQSNYIWGTGRRKTAVARVRIREGTGQFFVNNLPIENYFVEVTHATDAKSPLTLTDMGGRVDVFVNVKGSGKSSQSGAVVMGLARALKEFRPDLDEALRASCLVYAVNFPTVSLLCSARVSASRWHIKFWMLTTSQGCDC